MSAGQKSRFERSFWELETLLARLVDNDDGRDTERLGRSAPLDQYTEPQQGFCVKSNGGDQNSGVIKLDSNGGSSEARHRECWAKCKASGEAVKTGCELIWNQKNQGCYLHTKTIDHGNGRSKHKCWIFPPVCASIHMTNFQMKGIPQQIEEDSGTQTVRVVDNCQQSKDVTLDQQDTHASSQSVENSYTQERSWSDTFSASVGTSVGFEVEEDLVFAKATESVEVTSSVGTSSTTSGSDTTTNVRTTITSQGDSSGATIIVPAYTSKIVHVDWQRFRVTMDYTATAICKDEKGNEERRTVDGTWRGAYLSQTRVYLEDKTAECPTAKECMCAGLVASPLRQGIECSNYLTIDGQFCYVRAQAPCANKEQLDFMDTPVDASLFRRSSDPCVNNDLDARHARFLQLKEALFARQMEEQHQEHF